MIEKFSHYLIATLLLGFAPVILVSQEYKVAYTPVSILIDGHEDFVWSKVSWSRDWKDIVSGDTVLYKTRFKSLWDDEHLYLLFQAYDHDIRATGKTDHEPLFSFDNVIEVFLDPKGDGLNYYELQVNPIGTRWELTLDKAYKDGGVARSPDELKGLEYEIHMEGSLNDSGDIDSKWNLEVSIPWRSIPDVTDVPPSSEFRANFSRVHQTDQDIETSPEYWLWVPMGEANIHIPERWGKLTFLEKKN